MRRTMRIESILIAGALALAGVEAGAQQEIIFGISAKPGSLQQLTAAEFTNRANERLAGKAVVKLFDSAQIGKDKELMQKLKLDMTSAFQSRRDYTFPQPITNEVAIKHQGFVH